MVTRGDMYSLYLLRYLKYTNFNLFNSYMKKGTDNFENIFYLTKYIQCVIILTCNQYTNYKSYIFFHNKS